MESHTGESHDCSDTLRKWRQKGEQLGILDLRKAYLQIHIDTDLWAFQQISYKNETYSLTRLGFGLASAPKIMSRILKTVLEQDETVAKATSHYIDDILVDQQVCSFTKVADHLKRFGLECKPPSLFKESKILGLQMNDSENGILWCRSNQPPSVEEVQDRNLTRRDVFSICGRLVAHYPVVGCMRARCSFLKRHCEGSAWNDNVGSLAKWMLLDLLRRREIKDPVGSFWHIKSGGDAIVWCDASDIALGVVLEIDGRIAEDGAWLRKTDDIAHINLAELDAVVKGVSVAINWDVKRITIMSDSRSVVNWLNALLENKHPIKSTAMPELLIR